ncbi:Protein CBG03971 [Caenorhabditis briggsae]|uniref:Protein CBG03971 n=1 Tax=Caenorhabditis briggsae TaxID=6238 RepID=A8WVV8_CAEBR|nr:Protein CBG03971 [Caenorhabditis briggsae]CAP24771.1 Protein CBG03971 [Caenorhabditis briggsae]
MNEDENKGIVFQTGYELPSQQRVIMQIANLRLHAWGVFSNVYRGTLVSPGTEQEIAIKKTWPKTPERNFELLFLSGIRRKPHKNVVQMLSRGNYLKEYESKEYYWMVDVWSAGCVVGEMMKGKVLFPSTARDMMLKLIAQAIGIPSPRDHDYMKVAKMIDPVSDVKVLGDVSQEWADFIGEILRYRPRERLHGPELLAHTFFDQIFTRNDCVAGKQYAMSVLRNEVKFTLKDALPTPVPVENSKENKDYKESKEVVKDGKETYCSSTKKIGTVDEKRRWSCPNLPKRQLP